MLNPVCKILAKMYQQENTWKRSFDASGKMLAWLLL